MAERMTMDVTSNPAPVLPDRNSIADFMERYAERYVAGPAPRDFGHPINRNHPEPEIASAVRTAIYALAQAVRTGVDQPEADWPQAARS